MKINNAWQKIGQTTVDLSNYYTKNQTNELLSAKADINDVPSAISQLINDSGYLSSQIDPIYSSQKFNIVFQGDNITRLVNDAGYLTSQTDPVYTADKSSLALKSELSNYLRLASGGSISGALTINVSSINNKFIIQNNYDKLTNASYKEESIKYSDVNGKILTRISHILYADHTNAISFRINNPNATADSDYVYFNIQYTDGGVKRILTDATITQGYATTQSTSTNNTTLATTAFVHNVVNAQIGNINSILDAINGEIL